MAGIFCCFWRDENDTHPELDSCLPMLDRRGPNNAWSLKVEKFGSPTWEGRFAVTGSSVYAQTNSSVENQQIFTDAKGNFLVWIGNIFSGPLKGRHQLDRETIFNVLSKNQDIVLTLANIQGPYSVIYFDKKQQKLYFARDRMGRHSLLMKLNEKRDRLTVSSSMNFSTGGIIEVPVLGIFAFDLKTSTLSVNPWQHDDTHLTETVDNLKIRLGLDLAVLNPVFQGRREILGTQRQPENGEISCYEEIIASVMKKKTLQTSISEDENLNILPTENKNSENLEDLPSQKKTSEIVKVDEETVNIVESEKTMLEVVGFNKTMPEVIQSEKGISEVILHSEKETSEVIQSEEETLENVNSNTKQMDISSSEKEVANIKRPDNVEQIMKSLSERPEIQERIQQVRHLLEQSILQRLQKLRIDCDKCMARIRRRNEKCYDIALGILFSGGIDSMILAALAHKHCPEHQRIELINVAFEKARPSDKRSMWAADYDVPDRITGRQALHELKELFPRRRWTFIECNVLDLELQNFRLTRLRELVDPVYIDVYDNLSCALWFASRGIGLWNGKYHDPDFRAILCGIGADELFGGYPRHRLTLERDGWSALSDELDTELSNLANTTMGTVNRVISDHGKQPLFPYLDENLVDYVSSLKAWERCYPTAMMPEGLGDKLLLRLLARNLGFVKSANVPHVPIHIGSGIGSIQENEATDENCTA